MSRKSQRLAGASSSAPPPPTQREFWSPERDDQGKVINFEAIYEKLLKRKHVPGRWVHFNKFSYRSFNAKLATMGWDDFLTQTVKGEFYPRLVCQYYANLKSLGGHMYSTLIKGQDITITPGLLQEILLIPNSGRDLIDVNTVDEIENPPRFNEVFTGRVTAFSKDLLPEARMMHKVICANIITKRGNFDRVTEDALKVLYCFMRGIEFNLAELILDRMSMAVNSPSLPYSCIITRIMLHFGISFAGEQAVDPEAPFNARSLSLMGIQEIEEEEDVPEHATPSPPASQDIPQAQAVSNVEIMAELVRQREDMQRIRRSQKRLHRRQGIMMRTLKNIARSLGCTSERSVEVSQREPLLPSQGRASTPQGSEHTVPQSDRTLPVPAQEDVGEGGGDSSDSYDWSSAPAP